MRRGIPKSKKLGNGVGDFLKICVKYRPKKHKISKDWGVPRDRDTRDLIINYERFFFLVVHSRSQAVGMWQALLEEGAIAHG